MHRWRPVRIASPKKRECHRRHCLSAAEANDSRASADRFLCAWLNSDLMTFYAQQQNIIRFAQGKQPQIKISDLGTIPFPTNFHFQETIVNLAEKVFDKQDSIESHKTEINNLVYQYYELSEEQIVHIQKSIKDF